MNTFGLIGYPLEHSFSAEWFRKKFEQEGIAAAYRNFPLPDLDKFNLLLEQENPLGLNVTHPHKERIIALLDEVNEDAKSIGAVNCIRIRNGKTTGYNTDVIGFERTLLPLQPNPVPALVFGTGGASLAIAWVLRKHGFPFRLVSRNEIQDGLTYDELTRAVIEAHPLLINTTPVGTWPDTERRLPITYKWINPGHLCYDLIYNPEKSLFLRCAQAEGARIKNGLEMLEIQAEESWKRFGI